MSYKLINRWEEVGHEFAEALRNNWTLLAFTYTKHTLLSTLCFCTAAQSPMTPLHIIQVATKLLAACHNTYHPPALVCVANIALHTPPHSVLCCLPPTQQPTHHSLLEVQYAPPYPRICHLMQCTPCTSVQWVNSINTRLIREHTCIMLNTSTTLYCKRLK